MLASLTSATERLSRPGRPHPTSPGCELCSLTVSGPWPSWDPVPTPAPATLGLGSWRLTSRREAAVDLGVHFLVPHIASNLLHRLADDGDGQHEALRERETERG